MEISEEGLATGCTRTSTDPWVKLCLLERSGYHRYRDISRLPDKQSLLGMSGHAQST